MILSLCCRGSIAHASDIQVSLKESVLKISGSCTGELVAIDLKNEDKVVYNSQTTCQNEEYSFRDDLSVWGIPEGAYQIVINGQALQQPLTYKKEKAPEHELVSLGSEKKPLVKEEKAQTLSLDGAIAQFGESLKKLDESLKVIEDEAQKNTAYTDSLKGSLVSVMRDALGVLTGFFKDFEDASTEVEMTEEVSDTVPYPASGQEEKGTQENSTEKTINNTDVKNENNDSQVSPDDVLQTSGLRVEGQETAQ